MKTSVIKSLARSSRNERGFTLVELLVVVGIIVALAAAIIPAVTAFSNRGETGARAAELDSVQAAMDTMMANTGSTSVTANGTATADLSSILSTTYLRSTSTRYCYTWTAGGVVTQDPAVIGPGCV